MKAEDLSDAMNKLDSEMILEAEENRGKNKVKNKMMFRILASAAVIILAALSALLIRGSILKRKEQGANETDPMNTPQATIANSAYLDLDSSKGLSIIVWQFAENNYSCALAEGTGGELEIAAAVSLKAVSPDEMLRILSHYDIPDEMIVIVPYRNPLSSYYLPYDEETFKNYQTDLEKLFNNRFRALGWLRLIQ